MAAEPSGVASALLRRRLLQVGAGSAFGLSLGALFVLVEHLTLAGPDDPPPPVYRLGQRLPPFAVPPLGDSSPISRDALAAAQGPVLLNVFASWCAPCKVEMPLLLQLRQQGVPIWGIAYRDTASAAAGFLQGVGNPYQRVGHDDSGQALAGFELAGVPDSYLVDSAGTVHWSRAGGLSAAVVTESLQPILRALTG